MFWFLLTCFNIWDPQSFTSHFSKGSGSEPTLSYEASCGHTDGSFHPCSFRSPAQTLTEVFPQTSTLEDTTTPGVLLRWTRLFAGRDLGLCHVTMKTSAHFSLGGLRKVPVECPHFGGVCLTGSLHKPRFWNSLGKLYFCSFLCACALRALLYGASLLRLLTTAFWNLKSNEQPVVAMTPPFPLCQLTAFLVPVWKADGNHAHGHLLWHQSQVRSN